MSKLILIDEETQKANKENKNNTRFAELFTEKYAEKIGVDHFNNLLKVKDKESQEKIINDKDFQDALKEATAALKEIEKSDPDHFPKILSNQGEMLLKIYLMLKKQIKIALNHIQNKIMMPMMMHFQLLEIRIVRQIQPMIIIQYHHLQLQQLLDIAKTQLQKAIRKKHHYLRRSLLALAQ